MTKEYLESENIFDLIDIIQQHTAMFIPDKSVTSLFTFLAGYVTCLELHRIVEDQVPNFQHFAEWLRKRFDHWNLSYGWAYAIKENIEDNQDPLIKFFCLISDFRKLRLEIITNIHLNEEQKRNIKEIKIIKYNPEDLFFLRIYYNEKLIDDISLFRTLEEAQSWAEERY